MLICGGKEVVVFDAILFDLDETLVDRQRSLARYMRELYERYQLPVDGYGEFYGRFVELDRFGYATRQDVFAMLIDEFGVDATMDAWLADFRLNAWAECLCFADAVDVLCVLRGRGYQLGIVTNGSRESQRAKIKAAKLGELVDVILVSAEEGVAKPEPAIFLMAAERLGVEPTACLFVGDNPSADILGAQSVGMQAVWVRRHLPWPQTQAPCRYTINQLGELLSLRFGEILL